MKMPKSKVPKMKWPKLTPAPKQITKADIDETKDHCLCSFIGTIIFMIILFIAHLLDTP